MARQKPDANVRAGLIRPGRPEPDEAPLGEDEQPTPQPERHEPRVEDPSLADLSWQDYKAIFIRAFKGFMADNATLLASALAYASFLAIPSALLVLVGLFTLVASPETITSFLNHLSGIVPPETTKLLKDSLLRLDQSPSSGVVMTIVGFLIALWSATGAMTAYMIAVNIAYGRKDRRKFVRKRIVAVEMVVVMVLAFALVAALLIFGPYLEHWIGDTLGIQGVLSWAWWLAQWPILLAGLLVAFATMLFLGPDVDHPRWQFLTPGAVVAVVIWIAASGLFSVYTSMFGSYNKTWGSLAAVIVMLTWLWISAMALLLGAEINAEAERSRELRQGEPAAQRDVQAPAKV
jgi:membrane protein